MAVQFRDVANQILPGFDAKEIDHETEDNLDLSGVQSSPLFKQLVQYLLGKGNSDDAAQFKADKTIAGDKNVMAAIEAEKIKSEKEEKEKGKKKESMFKGKAGDPAGNIDANHPPADPNQGNIN